MLVDLDVLPEELDVVLSEPPDAQKVHESIKVVGALGHILVQSLDCIVGAV